MLILGRVSGVGYLVRRTTLFTILCACMPLLIGCACGITSEQYDVTGIILDSDTLQGLSDAFMGGRILTDGVETDYIQAVIGHGERNVPAPSSEGVFRLPFAKMEGYCFPGPPVEVDLPTPDQVEVIAVRGDCEQRFSIELNADTVVDLSFPNNVIELREPILVPPCED